MPGYRNPMSQQQKQPQYDEDNDDEE